MGYSQPNDKVLSKRNAVLIAILAVALIIVCFMNYHAKFENNSDQPNQAISTLLNSGTTQTFSSQEIDADKIAIILKAGTQAPSAKNNQPWHFSVITNKDILERINTDTIAIAQRAAEKDLSKPKPPQGYNALFHAPVAIVISGAVDIPSSTFDTALACENMSIAAQSLGLGSHILMGMLQTFSGPNETEYRNILGIPTNQKPVVVLLIGVPAPTSTDTVSKATPRKPDVVTYVK